MGVRAAILDLDGTLLDAHGSVVPGVSQMMEELRQAGLKLAIATNRPGGDRRAQAAGLEPDLFLTNKSVGSNKGSRRWVSLACEELGIGQREVVWLGDSDPDMRSAVNAHIPYFHATWSNPSYRYGIHMSTPQMFSLVTRECFAKNEQWYIENNRRAADEAFVRTYALTDSRGAGSDTLMLRTRHFLKDRLDSKAGPMNFGVFVAFHLLGSLFNSGLAGPAQVWTIYPGSRGGVNASLEPFVHEAARLFRNNFYDDLFVRHTSALDSGQTRAQGGTVGIGNQINTMQLNPKHRELIRGKRVIVIDDFETEGHSMECARNLLQRAGAEEVTGVAIGKYQVRYRGVGRYEWTFWGDDHAWDPYRPFVFDADLFTSTFVPLPTTNAHTAFRASYERILKAKTPTTVVSN